MKILDHEEATVKTIALPTNWQASKQALTGEFVHFVCELGGRGRLLLHSPGGTQ